MIGGIICNTIQPMDEFICHISVQFMRGEIDVISKFDMKFESPVLDSLDSHAFKLLFRYTVFISSPTID